MKDIFYHILAMSLTFIIMYADNNNLPWWETALISGCVTFIICFVKERSQCRNN